MVFVILSGPFRNPALITRTIVSLIIEPLKGILFVLFWGSFKVTGQPGKPRKRLHSQPTYFAPPPPPPAAAAQLLWLASCLWRQHFPPRSPPLVLKMLYFRPAAPCDTTKSLFSRLRQDSLERGCFVRSRAAVYSIGVGFLESRSLTMPGGHRKVGRAKR